MRFALLFVAMVGCGKGESAKQAPTGSTPAPSPTPAASNASVAARRALAQKLSAGEFVVRTAGADDTILEFTSKIYGCKLENLKPIVDKSGQTMVNVGFTKLRCIDSGDYVDFERPVPATVPVDVAPVAPAPEVTDVTAKQLHVDVTGRQLYEDYKRNPDDADAKYLNKMLRVHCIVGGSHGTTSLEIEVASGRDHIAAWFTDESASAMRQLRHYQEVFIRCRGGGMLDVPQLRDCVLEQVVRDPAAPKR